MSTHFKNGRSLWISRFISTEISSENILADTLERKFYQLVHTCWQHLLKPSHTLLRPCLVFGLCTHISVLSWLSSYLWPPSKFLNSPGWIKCPYASPHIPPHPGTMSFPGPSVPALNCNSNYRTTHGVRAVAKLLNPLLWAQNLSQSLTQADI